MPRLNAVSLSCEYQPLICLSSGRVKAHEALARFYDPQHRPIPPNLVFEALHVCPEALSETEYAAKCLQLADAPQGGSLFVNLDPHSLCPSHLSLLLPQLEAREHLVVELIENSCIQDAIIASKLAAQLKRRNIAVALDDIGAPHAMLSLDLLPMVDCMKFDRHWLGRLDAPNCRALLQSLVSFARACNKPTVIEGIETQAQLTLAQALGIDMGQGFLFRPQFMHSSRLIPLTPLVTDTLSAANTGAGA